MSVIHSLKWSFLAELASKAITPVVFIFLARLLTPDDFGLMSAATMVIAFCQILWEAGMGKALIQRQTDELAAANVAFWINITLALLISALLFWGAGPIATIYFKDLRVTAVIQIMTLQIFFGGLSSVHIALMQKEMSFRKLFWVRLVTVSLPGMASIPLAWMGLGYWALVAGTLSGQAAQVLMLWRMSHWRPFWSFDMEVAKEMGRFGAWVGISGILSWFFIWADSFIVGNYLGTHDLGLYRTGNQLVMMVFALAFGSISPVFYSHISRMKQDKKMLREAIDNIIRLLTISAVPMAVIIYFLSDQIAQLLFHRGWVGIGLVIGVMALSHGLSWINGMNPEVYRAAGKPEYETIAMIIQIPIYISLLVLSVRRGLATFVWCRLFLTVGTFWIHFVVLRLILKSKILPKLSHLIFVLFLSSSFVYLIKLIFRDGSNYLWYRTLFEGAISLSSVAIVLFILNRDLVLKSLKICKS